MRTKEQLTSEYAKEQINDQGSPTSMLLGVVIEVLLDIRTLLLSRDSLSVNDFY